MSNEDLFDIDTGGLGEDDEEEIVNESAIVTDAEQTVQDHPSQLGLDDTAGPSNESQPPLFDSSQQSLLDERPGEVDPAAKIPYARTQKRINPRILKRELWKLMTKKQQTAAVADAPSTSRASLPTAGQMSAPTNFARLCRDLPARLPDRHRADLTSPIAFVIFLHLCNENVSVSPLYSSKL